MSLRTPEKTPLSLNDEMVVSDDFLKQYLEGKGINFKPTGEDYILKRRKPKPVYTDLRTIYPSQKPFQKPGDFKKKKKRGRPKKAGRPKNKN